MTDKITVQYDDARVSHVLDQLMRAVGPSGMAGAFAEMGEDLTESTKRRFASSTAPDGTPWPPNAQATLEAYLNRDAKNFRKDGRLSQRGATRAANKRPLVDTGQYADSFLYQITDGGLGLELGTNRFADEWDGGAAVHQFGNKAGTIPARPALGVSDEDETDVLEILFRHLERAAVA